MPTIVLHPWNPFPEHWKLEFVFFSTHNINAWYNFFAEVLFVWINFLSLVTTFSLLLTYFILIHNCFWTEISVLSSTRIENFLVVNSVIILSVSTFANTIFINFVHFLRFISIPWNRRILQPALLSLFLYIFFC